MVEFDLTLPKKQNVVWLPKVLINSLGRNLKVTANSAAAVLYGADAEPQAVLDSLDIIRQDFQLRLKRAGASK